MHIVAYGKLLHGLSQHLIEQHALPRRQERRSCYAQEQCFHNAASEPLLEWLIAHDVPLQVLNGYLRSRMAAAPAIMQPLQQPWSCPYAAIIPCQGRWRDAATLPEGSSRMLTSRSSRQSQVAVVAAHAVHRQLRFPLLS